jgi:double zinc ribbon protein
MTCPRCAHPNPATARFCGECGAALEIECPGCRTRNPGRNKFCHECGVALTAPAVPAPTPAGDAPRPPAHLAEKILTSRGALEGERKQVTVLFADLKDSMELLADRDP